MGSVSLEVNQTGRVYFLGNIMRIFVQLHG